VARVLEVAHADRVLHLDPDVTSACRVMSGENAAGA
jgi:hypothetical protein